MDHEELFQFIEKMCQKYMIDESHGLKHAKGTIQRALSILATYDNVLEEERQIVIYAAGLHDMCDHKYTHVETSSNEIKKWLLGIKEWKESHVNAVIKIITTMSYSQLKINRLTGGSGFPNHGQWQRAYHAVRHADLLEGYIVARCILYNKHIHPDFTDSQHWQRAEELFEKRVFQYVPEGWIFIPAALQQAAVLEAEARRCLRERSLDW